MDFIVHTSAEQSLAHTPTLVLYARVGRLRDYPQQLDDPVIRLLPRWYREVIWNPSKIFDPVIYETSEAVNAGLPKMKEVVRRLYKAGVHIHLGSDVLNPFVVPGASLHEELQLFVEAGLTPEEAWVTGTRWPGEFLGVPNLAPSKRRHPLIFCSSAKTQHRTWQPSRRSKPLSLKHDCIQSQCLMRRMIAISSTSTAGCMIRLSPRLPRFCSEYPTCNNKPFPRFFLSYSRE